MLLKTIMKKGPLLLFRLVVIGATVWVVSSLASLAGEQPAAQNGEPKPSLPPSAAPKDTALTLRFRQQKGDTALVRETDTVRLTIKAAGETLEIPNETTSEGVEEVLEVEKGVPTEVKKTVSGFSMMKTDPQTGKKTTIGPLKEPVQLKIDYGVDPTAVEVLQGKMPEGLRESLTKPKAFLRLIPPNAVKIGESFKPTEKALTSLRDELAPEGTKVKSFDMNLKLNRVVPLKVPDGRNQERKARGEPEIAYVFEVAEISVDVKFEGVFGDKLPVTLEAAGKCLFAPEPGIVLLFALDGTFTIKPTVVVENGQKITLSGEGTAQTKYVYVPIDWKRGVSSQKEAPPLDSPPANPEKSPPKPPQPQAGKLGKVVLECREEPKEKAFKFLVPEGWSVEGGVFNVSAVQTKGPRNALAPKCDLRVKRDAAGTVMLPLGSALDLRRFEFEPDRPRPVQTRRFLPGHGGKTDA